MLFEGTQVPKCLELDFGFFNKLFFNRFSDRKFDDSQSCLLLFHPYNLQVKDSVDPSNKFDTERWIRFKCKNLILSA